MGFLNDDLNTQRPATATTPFADFTPGNEESAAPTDTTAPQGNANAVSDSVQTAAPATAQSVTEGTTDERKIDWSQPYADIEKNEELRKMTPHDIMRDFQKNGDGNWAVFMPWLQKYDPNKTVEQSEKDAERARRQAKWEQLGNLFQHVGNFFGTAIGAPSQKIESATELTERQRKIREATDALRQKGYDQMLVNIYKDRADKQAQMQAEANAKAKQAEAEYKGAQKAREEALTPELVKTEQAKQAASTAAAGLSTAKTKTEDELRGKKGELITAQTNNANAGAAEHRAGVAVAASTVAKNQATTQKIANTTPKYSPAEYGKRFLKYFNFMKQKGKDNPNEKDLATIYEEKYKIGHNGDKGKQWDANLQKMFVDDIEEQGLAPKSLGIGIGGKSKSGKSNKGKHLNI